MNGGLSANHFLRGAILLGGVLGSLCWLGALYPKPAIAQLSASLVKTTGRSPGLIPETEPLDLAALQADTLLPANPGRCVNPTTSAVTVNTICQVRPTIPSLWWAKEQFGGKLLENWLAYDQNGVAPSRIDLVVNPQVWSLLNYLERYAFINHFGEVARDYGYNVRIFTRQGTWLAAYTCDFNWIASKQNLGDVNPTASGIPCNLDLETPRRGIVQNRSPLGPGTLAP